MNTLALGALLASVLTSPLERKTLISDHSAVMEQSLVDAMISVESGWRPDVVSDKKAHGLMQITEWAISDVEQTHSSFKQAVMSDLFEESSEALWFLRKCTLKNKYEGMTHRNILRESLTEPELNVKIGTCYLLVLLKRYKGDLMKVLAAYNGGPKQVSLLEAGDSMAKETANYIVKVLRAKSYIENKEYKK